MMDQITFVLISSVFLGISKCQSTIRNTEYGSVEGTNLTLHNDRSVQAFLGIPFAQPPLGPLRFKHPLKHTGWSGTYNATYVRPSCWGLPLQWITHPDPLYDDFDEDCLIMNIYTPGDADDGTTSYPVMFWIHGGAYKGSGSVQYPGHFLASEGVIVVIIQYRLGQLGFLTTEDENAPGNCGMYDQVMALQFIHDNIAKFGGDPDKVTIFGQSAGGSSVGLHALSPLSRGLFHQIIAQSGTDMAPWAAIDPDEKPLNYAVQLVNGLNENDLYDCPTDNNTAMVECLRTVDPYELIIVGLAEVQESLGFITMVWGPIVDGPNGFLPDRPITLRENGEFAKVTVMSGLTTEDGSMFLTAAVPEASDDGFNITEWQGVINMLMKQLSPEGTDTEAAYKAIDFEYANWPYKDDKLENRARLVEMFTDVGMGIGNDLFTRSHSEHMPTFTYLLGYKSKAITEEEVPEWMGVPHNGDLPYVFGYPFIGKNPIVAEHIGNSNISIVDWNEEDEQMAYTVMKMWSNFAIYGNPTPQPVKNTTWPMFTTADYNYLNIQRNGDFIIDNPTPYNPHRLAFWTEYAPWILKGLQVPSTSTAVPSTTTASSMASNAESTSAMVPPTTTPSGGVNTASGQDAEELTQEGQNFRIATIALGVACGVLFLLLLFALWRKSKTTDSKVSEENGNYEINPISSSKTNL